MPPMLTSDQLLLLQQSGGSPVAVIDPQTQKRYYLVSEEQLHILSAGGEFNPDELLGLALEAADQAGWNAPEMEMYDRYDEHRE